MASEPAVLAALDLLAGADPKAFVRNSTPAAYVEILRDVDDEALKAASLMEWARFPSAHELRRAALAMRAMHYDGRATLEALWIGYFGDGTFHPAEWDALAEAFERAGGVEMSAHVREKKRRIELLASREASNA